MRLVGNSVLLIVFKILLLLSVNSWALIEIIRLAAVMKGDLTTVVVVVVVAVVEAVRFGQKGLLMNGIHLA